MSSSYFVSPAQCISTLRYGLKSLEFILWISNSGTYTFGLQLVSAPGLQLFQITISLAQHPNGEREFEVRVGDRDRPIEHPLDRLLRP